MGIVHFRTNVLLKSIIGKDLITDDNIAVLELVKNSFDANSKKVEIIFLNTQKNDDKKIGQSPNANSSKIIIKDTGVGMGEDDLKNKWLNIAYSEKKLKREEFGRVLAGNKGVGRFSCDRLGQFLNIYTKKRDGDFLHLFINWKQFEIENKIDLNIQDIELEIKSISKINFKKVSGYELFEKGTILEISKLREQWEDTKILGLKRHLEKLINPNQAFRKNQNAFEIQIVASEYIRDDKSKDDYERINGPVTNKIFEKLNFRTTSIESSIDATGKIITTKLQDRGKQIFLLKEKNKFSFLKNIDVTVYYLSTYSKIYFSKQTGIRSFDFGSIFLFINGFRVPPYGEVGDDWLGLETRKGQGYSRFLGTREIIGRIEINDRNDQFKIISNRAGVVNNRAFEQLTKSTSPFGYFYKTFRRLERFVVEGIKWDSSIESEKKIQDKINKSKNWETSNEEYRESELDRNKRILSVIQNIIDTRKEEIVDLQINRDFIIQIIEEQTKKAKDDLDIIANEIKNKNLSAQDLTELINKIGHKSDELKGFSSSIDEYSVKISKKELADFQKLQKDFQKKYNELDTLKNKLIEVEERERLLKEKERLLNEQIEIEKEKNTYLKSSNRNLSEDAKGLVHNIKMTAKEINSNTERLIEKIKSNDFKENEMLKRLGAIKFNAEKALKISMLITRANFRTQANNQIIDVVKYIEQYLEMYTDIFQTSQINIKFINNNSSLIKKVSVLDLSLVFDDLISNSIKAKAKEVLVEITNIPKNRLRILFSDSGSGVPKKFSNNPEQIFELGVTTTEEGSGIGMNSIRTALKGMNATIIFKGNNIKLKGASFEIIFN